jgi:hypothetical protein
MSATNPTFEEVDKHFQAADLSAFRAGGKYHLAPGTPAAQAIPNICPIYKIVRPFLLLASNLPLIPQKWRDAIAEFVKVMDTFCP